MTLLGRNLSTVELSFVPISLFLSSTYQHPYIQLLILLCNFRRVSILLLKVKHSIYTADCLPSHLFSDLTLCYREEEIIITPRTQIQKSLEFILLFLSLHVYSLCGILHPQILDVLYFQVLLGIFILCVCPLYTEFNIFLCKETSLLSCRCLSVISWAFLKCKLKGRSSCPYFRIKLYQVPLPLSEIPMPHFSPKYCFIILFS